MRIFLTQIVRSINRTAYDRAIADELQAHIDMHIADNIRLGMDPAAARRDAFLRLGGVQQTMESCWDVGTIRWLARLLQPR